MKDLIDREMAIKEIENEFAEVLTSHGYDSYEKADIFFQWYCDGLMKAIGILLDMEAEQPHWIPCSERLPEDGKWCLFTDGENMSVERYKLDASDHFFPNGRWFDFDDAVAWMPLPEPYEERR